MPAGASAMPKKDNVTPTESVRLHADVVRAARIITAVDGGSITDLVSNAVRDMLKKRLAEIKKEGFDIDNPPRK